MFKTVRSWIFWWNRSRTAKKAIKNQIALCKKMGKANPPTHEQVEQFKKEWDLGWESHMIQKVESKKTYFEASLS